MDNLWRDDEAERYVADYAAKGVNRDLALRTYTTRLLGGQPRLVLHGGGNTSVKTEMTDLVGDRFDVLCVKGSGWDMGTIEPPGLPAVKIASLLKSRKLDRLSDEDMVTLLRANLIDPSAPNPSVEALLHAFIPHKFVDHTHSTAILAIADQAESKAMCDLLFGKKMGFVPYIMPGFALAKAAAEVFDQDPTVDGLILDKHGIFTFGATAKEAYDDRRRSREDQRPSPLYPGDPAAGARQPERHRPDAPGCRRRRQGRGSFRADDQRLPHLAADP